MVSIRTNVFCVGLSNEARYHGGGETPANAVNRETLAITRISCFRRRVECKGFAIVFKTSRINHLRDGDSKYIVRYAKFMASFFTSLSLLYSLRFMYGVLFLFAPRLGCRWRSTRDHRSTRQLIEGSR